jgi:hypothetical protein
MVRLPPSPPPRPPPRPLGSDGVWIGRPAVARSRAARAWHRRAPQPQPRGPRNAFWAGPSVARYARRGSRQVLAGDGCPQGEQFTLLSGGQRPAVRGRAAVLRVAGPRCPANARASRSRPASSPNRAIWPGRARAGSPTIGSGSVTSPASPLPARPAPRSGPGTSRSGPGNGPSRPGTSRSGPSPGRDRTAELSGRAATPGMPEVLFNEISPTAQLRQQLRRHATALNGAACCSFALLRRMIRRYGAQARQGSPSARRPDRRHPGAS